MPPYGPLFWLHLGYNQQFDLGNLQILNLQPKNIFDIIDQVNTMAILLKKSQLTIFSSKIPKTLMYSQVLSLSGTGSVTLW